MYALRLTLAVLANVLIVGIPLFALAGTFDWWRAWVIVGLMFVGSLISVLTLPRSLIEERMKPAIQEGQPVVDRVLIVALLSAFASTLILTPLDVFRLHLLPKPWLAVSSLGVALFVVGYVIAYLALRENVFAAPVVRHQSERGQTVTRTGVYAVVRHPMYAGGSILMIGLPLWLESYAGVLAGLLAAAVLAVRITQEERFLRRELPGYEDYVRQVHYRLLPFVW